MGVCLSGRRGAGEGGEGEAGERFGVEPESDSRVRVRTVPPSRAGTDGRTGVGNVHARFASLGYASSRRIGRDEDAGPEGL